MVMTGTGPKLVVPNIFAHELANHPYLLFTKSVVNVSLYLDTSTSNLFETSKDFFITYPGFEPLKVGLYDNALIQETVRAKLTQSLALITEDLVSEVSAALHNLCGEDHDDWRTVPVLGSVTDIVARVVSRVLLGPSLCRTRTGSGSARCTRATPSRPPRSCGGSPACCAPSPTGSSRHARSSTHPSSTPTSSSTRRSSGASSVVEEALLAFG